MTLSDYIAFRLSNTFHSFLDASLRALSSDYSIDSWALEADAKPFALVAHDEETEEALL
jgi:hypothetical protein